MPGCGRAPGAGPARGDRRRPDTPGAGASRHLFTEADPERRTLITCSPWPPRPPSCAGSPSSPAGQGRGKPRPWPDCWRFSTSRRSPGAPRRHSSPWRRRRESSARLEEAVRKRRPIGPGSTGDRAQRLLGSGGTTLHRLLGFNAGNRTRFRHNRSTRFPTMSWSSTRPPWSSLSHHGPIARGATLRRSPDYRGRPRATGVGRSWRRARRHRRTRFGRHCMDETEAATGRGHRATPFPPETTARSPIGDGMVLLRNVQRHSGAIAAFARAIRRATPTRRWRSSASGDSNVDWLASIRRIRRTRAARGDPRLRGPGAVVPSLSRLGPVTPTTPSRPGELPSPLRHRRGPEGVATWMEHIEKLAQGRGRGLRHRRRWYLGRPLIVTENDYALTSTTATPGW